MDKQDTRKLLQKYRDGRCTPEERSWVEQWYLEIARLQNVRPADLEDRHTGAWKQIRQNISREKNKEGHWQKYPLVAAASVILILGLSFLVYRKNHTGQTGAANAIHYTSMVTKNGELRKLALPDGSEVWLNAASKLRFSDQFGKPLREVFLDEGEAYFDVKHDTGKPFVVYAGKTKTTVLGTAFAVKAYRSLPETQVTVARGKVGVVSSDSDRKNAVFLIQNQQITFDHTQATFSRTDIRAADFTGWTEGKLKFNNERFNTIALMLEKRFDTPIRFSDKTIGELRFSAGFGPSEKLDDILEVLCLAENLTYHKSGKAVILSGK